MGESVVEEDVEDELEEIKRHKREALRARKSTDEATLEKVIGAMKKEKRASLQSRKGKGNQDSEGVSPSSSADPTPRSEDTTALKKAQMALLKKKRETLKEVASMALEEEEDHEEMLTDQRKDTRAKKTVRDASEVDLEESMLTLKKQKQAAMRAKKAATKEQASPKRPSGWDSDAGHPESPAPTRPSEWDSD
eukprot:NODE_2311_length_722_cov_48.421991_g1869_i0.p1 GENE.NODE_2311_length_722_cov_48.421991_g1869_i0~~NODE_2311_length_722_cov_48.421991_g1869_i0.p1  ORF type:complete len:193 (-),score=58.63 NODE_2311_length_722_cov_48.421991_g1869_i0:112-690(-)